MKDAHSWAVRLPQNWHELESAVRQIQADALRHAAGVAENMTDTIENDFGEALIVQAGRGKIACELRCLADALVKEDS